MGSFLLGQNETGGHANFQRTFRSKYLFIYIWCASGLVLSGLSVEESKINMNLQPRCQSLWQRITPPGINGNAFMSQSLPFATLAPQGLRRSDQARICSSSHPHFSSPAFGERKGRVCISSQRNETGDEIYLKNNAFQL